MSKSAAQRYAKALYNIAEEEKILKKIFEDMQLIESTLAANKNLQLALGSPVISEEKKLSIAKEVFKKLHKNSINLIQVLAQNGRIEILNRVAKAFVLIYEKAHQIHRAHVVTAVKMDAQFEKQVQAKIKQLIGSEAELSSEVEPSIIGGFVLRIEDMQYDASVVSQLNKVRSELVN